MNEVLNADSVPLKDLIKNPRTFMRSNNHPLEHAKDLDRTLGFRIPRIEGKLLQKYKAYYKQNDGTKGKQHFQGTQTWIGLHPQVLQTPYNDIFEALYLLKDFEVNKVVDIGAGYGRVGIVMNSVFPEARFIGYEILKQRESEGNRLFERLELLNCEILLEDVLEDDFILPKAQIYFIYDFSEIEDISKILDELVARVDDYSFFLVTRGDRIDFLLERKYKKLWNANGRLSSGELKIYSSNVDLKKLKHKE
ncbi:class I SAM-dependent methyltransferase [Halobacteriovorax sp. XZX-3]|uniref:class I SAM-dependent methyltransferase n=1 Tax=unclassified Halobacteriovorax TaxID=2639665 RepID=UPI000CD0308A|nr:class I SAM-dependent methyltransferase [Halobacteriovorax sp. DA5]POB13518.1 hypothetical protein C0Z22_10155 [Halobacteriovorax sp. DA5]